MGKLLAPQAWCREKWCREGENAEHQSGDGCSCHPHAEATAEGPRLTRLTAKAARLAAFACRVCGSKTRRMVEQPVLFFRCESCASADHWPALRSRR